MNQGEWFNGLMRQVDFQVSNIDLFIGSLLVVPSLNVAAKTSLEFNSFLILCRYIKWYYRDIV